MTRSRSTVFALLATLLAATGCGSEPTTEGSRATASLRITSAPIGQSVEREAMLTPATASIKPARPGERAEVEASTDGGDTWSGVGASGRQDEDGEVRLQLPAVGPDDEVAYRVVASADGEEVVSEPVTPTAQVEVFADDFDDPDLFAQQWAQRYTNVYHGNRMCATPSPDRVTLADGVLTLSVAKILEAGARSPGDPAVVCDNGVWDNAMIGTLLAPEPFAFTYGTAAARLRMQPGGGMHSGFWLQQAEADGAEIDIAEYYGDGYKAGLQSKIHYGTGDELETSGGTVDLSGVVPEGSTPADGWHVYSVQWTPDEYVFAVDGVVTMVTDQPAVSTKPEEIALSLLTSDWSLSKQTRESSTMQVDWVRVWQDPEDAAEQQTP